MEILDEELAISEYDYGRGYHYWLFYLMFFVAILQFFSIADYPSIINLVLTILWLIASVVVFSLKKDHGRIIFYENSIKVRGQRIPFDQIRKIKEENGFLGGIWLGYLYLKNDEEVIVNFKFIKKKRRQSFLDDFREIKHRIT